MIKKIFKIIMIMIPSIIVILMIVSQLLMNNAFAPFILAKYILTYKYANYEINRECDKIEKENRDKNTEIAKEWVRNVYGPVVSSAIEIKYKGRIHGWATDSHYVISAPFVDDASVYVESETHNVHGGFDFWKSPKFQHLYSEWVKKQAGIDDDNVEFQFAGNFDNPYIEFDKITSLSEDYREIFENTHNLYAWLCEVSSIRDLTDENIIEIAKNIRENYLLKAIQITKIPTDKKFGGRIRISSGENTNEKSIVYNVDFDINSLSDNFSDMEYRRYD